MTKNNTKKALLMSTLSMLLCLSMLIGSTFAWFTDSASTAVNKIQSGTLDVVLEVSYDGGTTWQDAEGQTLQFKTADGRKDNILWEPGCTYELPLLRVRNEGNLWLKYQLAITGIDGDAKLNDAIEWTYIVENAEAELGEMKALNEWESLSPKNGESDTSDAFTIKGNMKEEAGNEYQNLTIDGIGITVFATQLYMEQDSIGPDYDEDAPTLIMIEDETYKTLAEAVAAAENGDVIELAGTFTLPTDGSLKNKKLTFKGIKDNITVIEMNKATGQSTSGAELTFDGITLVAPNKHNGSLKFGIQHVKSTTFKNSTIKGNITMYGETATFENCEFINYADYNVWTYGVDVTFTDCTFTTGGKAVLVYNDGPVTSTVTATNCVFNSNGQLATDKAAIEVGNDATSASTHTLIIDNCTENGFAANKSSSALYGNKNEMDADHLKVYINGTLQNSKVEENVITNAEELKNLLTMAGEAGAGNSVINLTANVDLTGQEWTPVNVDGYNGADVITLNGNGHTIYGLSAPLFKGGFAGGSGIVINDLTIANSNITSTNTLGSGAFIETVDSMDTITLNNCHLKDSTITGSRTGGLIGWTSGYNNTNDGAVKTYVTVKDCSVVNCTIQNTFNDEGATGATESVGAIFGHAGNNPWTYTTIENCLIKDNTLIGGTGKTGVILGTANVGEVTITGCTMENNTVNGAESDAVYGRTAFGSTGKLTIDGEEIK